MKRDSIQELLDRGVDDIVVKPDGTAYAKGSASPCGVVIVQGGIMIPGLPEGVQVVRWGVPEEEEYLLDSHGLTAQGIGIGLVVRIASGYQIRYDLATNQNRAFRVFPSAKKVTLEFMVEDGYREAELMDVKEKFRGVRVG